MVILAGTNDIAGNTGPMTDEQIAGNLASMAEIAKANGIRVVFSSILPVSEYHVRPGDTAPPQTTRRPMARITALNAWMKDYAAANGHVYLDYVAAMADAKGLLRAELSEDDLHPNAAGYAIMGPLAEAAIQAALRPAGRDTLKTFLRHAASSWPRQRLCRSLAACGRGGRRRRPDSISEPVVDPGSALSRCSARTSTAAQRGASMVPTRWQSGWMGVTAVQRRSGKAASSVFEGPDAREGRSLRVLYPQDGVGPQQGGAQWKMGLGARHEELYCAYSVRFAHGFRLRRKAANCRASSAAPPTREAAGLSGRDGWSARMMWRSGGTIVQYVYHVGPADAVRRGPLPGTSGASVLFRPGQRGTASSTAVVMNRPGQRDGIVQGWFDGALALDRRNIRFRDVDTFAIDAFYFSTFFGGDDPSWAPAKDERVDFDQFVIATARA